jgi:hypothetical protein
MSKVIELAVSGEGVAQAAYPDDEVETINPYLYLNDPLPLEDGSVDGMFATHVLNHIPYQACQAVLLDWSRVMKPKGLLHVIVPSFEWLARSVLQEEIKPHIRPLLFGMQTDEYSIGLNALTMLELRRLMQMADFRVIKARVGSVSIAVGDTEHLAEQHYVVGTKGAGLDG